MHGGCAKGRCQWLEFRMARTRASSQRQLHLQFPGPATPQFRTLSEPESEYPFAAGTSNAVAVRER